MNVLIGCECSQVVCTEFRKLGHNAFSCDIQDCYGNHPEWHIKCDVLNVLPGNLFINTCDGSEYFINHWDLIIIHPPCTYLSKASKFSPCLVYIITYLCFINYFLIVWY